MKLTKAIQKSVVTTIFSYQFLVASFLKFIFPLAQTGGCRFYPSCSAYAHEAIDKYGLAEGTSKAFLRILRCHPFNKGGIDLI